MNDLIIIVHNFDNCRIIALVISCVVSLGIAAWIWSTAKHANLPLSTFQWAQIYFFALISFLSGVLVLGLLIVPKNAESLLDVLRIKGFVESYSRQVQGALIYIVNLLR